MKNAHTYEQISGALGLHCRRKCPVCATNRPTESHICSKCGFDPLPVLKRSDGPTPAEIEAAETLMGDVEPDIT
jgi:hypothetical protein